jgi:hypothetical protein
MAAKKRRLGGVTNEPPYVSLHKWGAKWAARSAPQVTAHLQAELLMMQLQSCFAAVSSNLWQVSQTAIASKTYAAASAVLVCCPADLAITVVKTRIM